MYQLQIAACDDKEIFKSKYKCDNIAKSFKVYTLGCWPFQQSEESKQPCKKQDFEETD